VQAISHINAETTLNVVPSVDCKVVRRGGDGVVMASKPNAIAPAANSLNSWTPSLYSWTPSHSWTPSLHRTTRFMGAAGKAKPASIQIGGGLQDRVEGRPAD